MAEFTDSVVGNEGENAVTGFQVEATDGGSASLPDGFSLSDSTFETDGSDLVLTNGDGAQVTVEGFFTQDNPPELVASDGAQISGDMAGQLAGGGDEAISAGTDSGAPADHDGGMIAENPNIITGTDGEPIGNVENLSGTVFAVRTDGTRVELNEGDPVYQGDIIESTDDGAIGILLADETTFSMGENGRIVLDEMVYDPATQEGSVNLSAIQGVFTFVSGQVAKTDPDAMTLDTPVATIGIRGTQVGLDVKPEGGGMSVVLMEEADGFVGEVVIGNNGGIQVLNGANQTTSVANFSTAPTAIRVMDMKELVSSFGNALKQLPKIGGNQNDFGLQDGDGGTGEEEEVEETEEGALDEEIEELEEGELTEEELEEFETAAGDEEGEGEGEGDDLSEGDDLETGLDEAAEVAAEAAAAALAAAAQAAADAAAQAAADAAAAAEAAAKAAAQAAAKAAAEAAQRAAEIAAELARQAAAAGQAQASAGLAQAAAKAAQEMELFARDLSNKTTLEESDLLALGRFAVSSDALKALGDVIQNAIDSALAADAAATAAAIAVEAAKEAVNAASGATGTASYGARDAAAALKIAEDALKDAEAAKEDAIGLYSDLIKEGGYLDLAEQAIAESDWVGDIDPDNLDDVMIASTTITTDQIMDGGAGNDYIDAGGGDDILIGGEGNDLLIGGDVSITSADLVNQTLEVDDLGNIYLVDGTGNRTLVEQGVINNGDDQLFGGAGDDILLGGAGDDTLTGGAGNDRLFGGEGEDTAILEGNFGEYRIERVDGVITVTSTLDGVDGDVDTLTGIEIIQFGDETVSVLDVDVNAGQSVAIDVTGALGDTDEAVSIEISGAPNGTVLTLADGTVIEPVNGIWTLTPEQLVGLDGQPANPIITTVSGSDTDFSLTITEKDANGNTTGLGFIDVDVTVTDNTPDAPTLDLDRVLADDQHADAITADEDDLIELDISAELTDETETLSITIGGIPLGAVLILSNDDEIEPDSNGEVTLTQEQLAGLRIKPPENDDSNFKLTVTATSTTADDETATTTGEINITLNAVADVPVINDVTVTQGTPGGAIPMGISSTGAADDPEPDNSSVHQNTGTDGDDVIYGEKREEFIDGGKGDDIIYGSGGADVLVGGEGNDYIEGGEGADDIFGGTGDDVLKGGKGADEIYGGDGNDTIEGGEGADILSGGAGDDFIDGGRSHEGGEGEVHFHDDSQSDTVLFTGSRDQYMITQNADGSFTVVDMFADRDGTDTVIRVENFQFSDGIVSDDDLLTTNPTTFIVNIDAELTDTDGSEVLSFSITGLPEGAYLTLGTEDPPESGIWTFTDAELTAFELAGGVFGVVVPYDVEADFNLTVEAISTETSNDDTASTSDTSPSTTWIIPVDGDASPPSLDLNSGLEGDQLSATVTDDEDTAIALDISAALVDNDGSETLSITISGVPAGAVLSAGTETPEGSGIYTLTVAQLENLTITPPPDSSDDFQLTVSATSDETADGIAITSGTINVTVDGVSDGATLDLNVLEGGDQSAGTASGDEGTAIPLDISAGLNVSSETLSITIGGVPLDAELSAGVEDSPGTWVIKDIVDENGTVITTVAEQLADLTLTTEDTSGTFTLDVTATATDESSALPTTGTITVTVDGVADGATLDLNSGIGGDQDTGTALGVAGTAIALYISATINDDSETASITISGLPAGAFLSAGVETSIGSGIWILDPTAGDLNGLTITTLADDDGDFTLTVTATTTDGDSELSTSGTIAVTVDPAVVADTTAEGVTLTATDSLGDEDSDIALNISADLIDPDSETVSITISGVPDGATLSAGTEDLDNPGTWTLESGDLEGLTVTPPEDSNVDFDLTVTTTTTESDGGATTTSEATITVDVVGVADVPTVVASIGNVVNYQDAIMEHDPVAYFRMNEGEGNTVIDSSGNNTGSYKKGAESETDKGGIGGGTGDFDGRDDRIEVPHSEAMELASGSITVWFNSDDVNDKQGLFSMDSKGTNDGDLTAFVDDGVIKIRMQDADGNSHWIEGGTLADNSWSQVTFNWGPNGMELYVDGELVDSDPYAGGLENNNEPLVIGANSWSSDDGDANHLKDYFDGQIDEFAMMSEPLTAEEVATLYTIGSQSLTDNGGQTFELFIAADSADRDDSETISVVIGGVPLGATLSAGILATYENGDPILDSDGNTTWNLLSSEISGLTLTTDQTVIEDFDLTVTAVAIEDDGDTATALTTVHVDVGEISDTSVSLTGGSGDDILVGGSGDDILKGRGGDDQLSGGGGDDILYGSSGADILDGGSGADTLFGSSGRDILRGGEGDDYLDGGSDNDILDGGAGNDMIRGGRGDDIITGGAGNDRMEGGEGADTFMFDTQSGHDIITDILQQDVLVFEGQEFHMDDLILSENSDGDVVITFGGVDDASVTLDGVTLDDLDANNDGDPRDGYTISESDGGVTITIDSVG